ncbi:hypothetical protein QBZ16_001918 [Prototheca wickerhamii]|uniref:Ubiquitin-like protease family profile domain-containing protein n=1 Tax=Prototheca wickerhamii TaxID=3111 RepID=A0AAD9ILU9_PROWI|nr:hypothetical protein QBZ16_001918 [Prototheca wickerhamii]
MNTVRDWFRIIGEGLSGGKRKRDASSCALSGESFTARNLAEKLDFADEAGEAEVTPFDLRSAFGADAWSAGPFQAPAQRAPDRDGLELYTQAIDLYRRISKMSQRREATTSGKSGRDVVDLTKGTAAGDAAAARAQGPVAEPVDRPRHATPPPRSGALSLFRAFVDEFADERAAPASGEFRRRGSARAASGTPAAVRLAREESRRVLSAAERAASLDGAHASALAASIRAKDEEIARLTENLERLRLQRVEGLRPSEAPARPRVPLPAGAAERYRDLVSGAGPPTERLVEHEGSGISLTRHDMATLAPGAWLNDEVINLSMALLQARDAAARGGAAPRTHFFPTFFCNKLYKDGGYDYLAVRRWTLPKRLKAAGQPSQSVLDCDRIVVPVHQGIHWTCAVVDLGKKELRYYDALLVGWGRDEACLEALARWLRDEYRDKRKEEREDVLTWPRLYPQAIPRQLNGWDCGMFLIQFADHLGRGADMTFTQADMDAYRIKAVWDLMEGSIS